MLLGCIADDLTGATDLSLMLAREGLRTVQSTGLPSDDIDLSTFDALVIALKSRTIPAAEAVALSLAAAEYLKALGVRQYLFKYCSTFDSTDKGNIGPVAEALLSFTGGSSTIACPAFPRAGREVFHGYLFVGGQPLNESPMKDHPLTPMRDANLVRVLQRQTELSVGLVDLAAVDAGPDAIGAALAREVRNGHRIQIVDALKDRHLRNIGAAVAEHALVTGGSGIAMGLPAAYLKRGWITNLRPASATMAAPKGRAVILAGSCSAVTRGQVAAALAAGMPAFQIDPVALAQGRQRVADIITWIDGNTTKAPFLVYSSADPARVAAAQKTLGREEAGAVVEKTLADLARELVPRGMCRLVVGGGETAGAVVQALGIGALAIEVEIDPGVPWTRSLSGPDMALALKSGNFGSSDFFLKAWEKLA